MKNIETTDGNLKHAKPEDEWNPASRRPREGGHYTIKLASGKVIPGVLYENGMYWKKRTGASAGQTWPAIEWRSIGGYEKR